MRIAIISIACAAALLGSAASASAAPVGVASADQVGLRAGVEQAAYCHRHHWRHHAWWPRYYRYYGYAAPVDAAVAVAAAPVEAAATVAAAPVVAATGLGYYGFAAPVASVPVVAASGAFCTTSLKTCLLREPGVLGTGCSCHVPGGIARGLVQ